MFFHVNGDVAMMVRWMGRLQVNAHLDVPMLLPKAKVDCWSWCLLRSMSDPFVVSTCVVWECRDNQRQHPCIPSKWQGWVCQKNLVWGTNKQGLTLITDPLLHVHFASCMAVLHHVTRKPSPSSDRIFHPGPELWQLQLNKQTNQTELHVASAFNHFCPIESGRNIFSTHDCNMCLIC